MSQRTIQLPQETAAFMESLFNLLGAVKASDPTIAAAFDLGGTRVSFDARERVVLVSIVDEQGHSHPFLGIQADPFDRTEFGVVGQPEPIFGMYDPRRPTH